MNAQLVTGAIVTIVMIAAYWFLYRLYKRIARRCNRKGCGKPTKRVHYIYLHADDKKLSTTSASGKFRWFFRRVIKVTLAECECGWIKLIRVDWEPISFWHLRWIKIRRKEQFDFPAVKHALVIYGGVRKLYHEKEALNLDPQETDTPPAPDLLDEFVQNLEDIIGGLPR